MGEVRLHTGPSLGMPACLDKPLGTLRWKDRKFKMSAEVSMSSLQIQAGLSSTDSTLE